MRQTSRLMLRHAAVCLTLGYAGAVFAGTGTIQDLQPQPQQTVAAKLVAELIGHYHYGEVAIDDALSEKIFTGYIEALDPEKLFLTQTDIDGWQPVRTRLDDAVVDGDLGAPFAIFNVYLRRVEERYRHARTLLKTRFDFQQNETYRIVHDDRARSATELDEWWRKRVKEDWLEEKLAGSSAQKIADILDQRYEKSQQRATKIRSQDVFQVFMNAFAEAVDPHTGYMGARASEDFNIGMSLSMEGIGALLEEKDGYATIKAFVPGGPATQSKRLAVGDRIVSVAQGNTAKAVDVVGWRLDETVALIRGVAGSSVRLEILPSGAGLDGKRHVVALTRRKITLDDQAAKKSVLKIGPEGSGHRIGVISLPSFYEDFEARQRGERNSRSASGDVDRLLKELKAEKVDGIIIDLRNNGGGSLNEAIDLTGLFIDTGPVVQQRDARGRISVGVDNRPGSSWPGPLGVLINRGSASASEIFAAAIQDYGRGVVIGEDSFGKGSVQSLMSLDDAVGVKGGRLGELRLTVAQFFRINGETTQLRGVQPDVRLPTLADTAHFGEASYGNALPWTHIRPTLYKPVDKLDDLLPMLRQHHEERTAASTDYQTLIRDAADAQALRQRKEISLNEEQRRQERALLESRLGRPAHPAADDEELGTDSKNGDDVLLKEAAAVVADEIELLKTRSRTAAALR